MERRFARRLVALAAAYALVLNAWLPALAGILTPQAGDGLGAAVVCAGVAGGAAPASDLPQRRLPLCPWSGACSMPGHTAPALPGYDAAPVAAPRGSEARITVILSVADAVAPWRGRSRFARGPPDA
jgi:hypothetical protein